LGRRRDTGDGWMRRSPHFSAEEAAHKLLHTRRNSQLRGRVRGSWPCPRPQPLRGVGGQGLEVDGRGRRREDPVSARAVKDQSSGLRFTLFSFLVRMDPNRPWDPCLAHREDYLFNREEARVDRAAKTGGSRGLVAARQIQKPAHCAWGGACQRVSSPSCPAVAPSARGSRGRTSAEEACAEPPTCTVAAVAAT